jgi:general stress protein 26
MGMLTAERMLSVARSTIEAAEICFLITLKEHQPAQARLMMPFGPEDDWTIWMGASPKSRKVRELYADARATLGYPLAQEGAYVTLLGTATIEDDRSLRKRYWRRRFIQYWPEGHDGDDYVLIKFVPSRIELMNFSQEVVPEPHGLQAAILLREGESWVIDQT